MRNPSGVIPQGGSVPGCRGGLRFAEPFSEPIGNYPMKFRAAYKIFDFMGCP
jgi:hypothetical protein